MTKILLCVAMLAVLVPVPAGALICTIDDVPAATLLLPYFEVDLRDANGINTLFSVNNASATAVLAHVVVWTDLSVPVLDFNIYLTGYDVQTVSMRAILEGSLPQTASDGQDPTDEISPQGLFSQDINFASCTGQLPYNALPANFVAHLQSTLTGGPSTLALWGGNCGAIDHGDDTARGYVTIDTVNNCTLDFPGDPGYFVSGGAGSATNQNVLWGDYFYVDPANNFAQGETLVHIEAAPGTGASGVAGNYPADPETTVNGEYTFYGRYVAFTAADNREPLIGTFASRFIAGGFFDGGTNLVVWRDPKIASASTGWACGSIPFGNPTWFPLGQTQIVIFDEEEQPLTAEGCQVSPCDELELLVPFPIETQRTVIGGPDFPVPFDFGWVYLNLNSVVGPAGAVPPENPAAMQNWVTTVMSAEGRFSVGFDAIALDSACNASALVVGGG
jgi:hypothetical protein